MSSQSQNVESNPTTSKLILPHIANDDRSISEMLSSLALSDKIDRDEIYVVLERSKDFEEGFLKLKREIQEYKGARSEGLGFYRNLV